MDLSKAKKELADKNRLIAELNKQIEELQAEKARLQEQHKSEIGKLRNGYQKEIDKAIHQAEAAERQFKEKDALIVTASRPVPSLYVSMSQTIGIRRSTSGHGSVMNFLRTSNSR